MPLIAYRLSKHLLELRSYGISGESTYHLVGVTVAPTDPDHTIRISSTKIYCNKY